MKKYITVAALLAAGTAFANAETVSLYDYATATNKDISQNGWTYGADYGTNQDSYVGVMDASNSTFNSSTGNRDAWRFCDGSAQGAIYAHKSIASQEIFAEDKFSVTFNVQLDTTSYYTTGANGASNFYNKAGSVESISLVVGDGTGVYWVKFGYNGTAITVADAGSGGGAYALTSFLWNELTDVTISIDKNLGTAVFSVGNDEVELKRSTTQLGAYNSSIIIGTVSSGDQGNLCVSSVTLSTVPEPSSFGMLAGLGALALVASRRRRK